MEQKELEFTKEMLERNDVLDNAVYKMCLTFLQFEDDENLDTYTDIYYIELEKSAKKHPKYQYPDGD